MPRIIIIACMQAASFCIQLSLKSPFSCEVNDLLFHWKNGPAISWKLENAVFVHALVLFFSGKKLSSIAYNLTCNFLLSHHGNSSAYLNFWNGFFINCCHNYASIFLFHNHKPFHFWLKRQFNIPMKVEFSNPSSLNFEFAISYTAFLFGF